MQEAKDRMEIAEAFARVERTKEAEARKRAEELEAEAAHWRRILEQA